MAAKGIAGMPKDRSGLIVLNNCAYLFAGVRLYVHPTELAYRNGFNPFRKRIYKGIL